MKNIILIFRQSAVRSRLMLALAIISGLIMGSLFLFLTNQEKEERIDSIDVGVLDHDSSPLSAGIKSYFSDTLEMGITESDDYDYLADRLLNADISAIIEIPQGSFDKALNGNSDKLVITTLNDYANVAFIEAYLNSYMQGITLFSRTADGDAEVFSELLGSDNSFGDVTVSDAYGASNEIYRAKEAFASTIGFFLMILVALTLFLSSNILSDKQLGTYRRMQCSSLKPWEYIVGTALFGIIAFSAMLALFMLFPIISETDIGVSYGLAFLGGELFVLFSVGIAIVFALCFHSNQTLYTVICGFTTIESMLGGAWFPIDANLGFLSSLAKVFPMYWFMEMLRGIPENPDFNWIPNICILALSALLVYLVSAVIFTKKSS